MREPMSPGRRRSIGQCAESAVNRTDVEDLLRICAEDVPALLQDLDGADRLRAELAAPVKDEDVRLTLRVLKAGDGTRRDGELLERAIRQAEAERDVVREQVKRLREQVERVRAYAREGCLGSKSAIYRRVGQDLLRIVGTGASDA